MECLTEINNYLKIKHIIITNSILNGYRKNTIVFFLLNTIVKYKSTFVNTSALYITSQLQKKK